jgi:hypothetical protein
MFSSPARAEQGASGIGMPRAAAWHILYQLDFVTPGISPASAKFRKQMRQSWNFLRIPRGRPQRRQRLCARTRYLGFRLAFAFKHVLATVAPYHNRVSGLEDCLF